jgi:hypothetical protein
LQRLANLALVAVSFSTIKVSKSCFQGISGSSHSHGWIGNQGAEAKRWNMADPIIERQSCHTKLSEL